MKYNFGSHNKKKEGYVNVDALILENVDIVHNLTVLPYPFAKPNSADEIVAVEFLEHISFKLTKRVLLEWYNILKVGGKLKMQVPDCGKAMEYYVNGQICTCVPHKDSTGKFEADLKCFNCGGKGIINPNRWLYSFTGAQKHEYDAHLNIFTKDRMIELLESCKFRNIEFQEDKYKIIVRCIK